ncbi:hypothetical protein BN890_12520 [Bacteroides xylanisolvens SD CC 1b]|uniref:Uncharacterized protein n=1 Tax=Bacteroides xylanisolvens SD CC 1b TaxID=702447 RepID=W6PI03_9BACE|nr:hypothetical protein BN890_12520 [Bacteroides xylanisolvens SD CC 1b]
MNNYCETISKANSFIRLFTMEYHKYEFCKLLVGILSTYFSRKSIV